MSVWANATVIFLLMSFDVMFLKKYYGNETVAYYATAIKLITILAMVINSVSLTTSTKIAEYFHLNERKTNKRHQNLPSKLPSLSAAAMSC